jgi:hypothetical protein
LINTRWPSACRPPCLNWRTCPKSRPSIFERYGPESKKPGTYAANCILARRLAERGVRFIQLYHRGWDQHNNLPSGIRSQCHDTDQPTAALLGRAEGTRHDG